MKKARRFAVLGAIVAMFGLMLPPPANAVLDWLECDPFGRTPRYADTHLNVVGSGFASGPTCSTVLDTLTVCLDYNQVTIPETCRDYSTPSGGDSRKYRCLPGVWDTMVIATYKDGTREVAHSGDGQGLPLIATDCRLQ